MLKLFTFLVLFITSILSAAPTFQAAGTYVNGTTNVTPTWPAHSINDLALLFVETRGGQAVNLSTPAGFTQVLNSPQDVPSTGGFFFFGGTSYGTRLTVFWARATSASMSAPVIQDPGNHVGAQILTYRGVITSGNPWDVTAGSTKTTASTSISAPAVTTTVNDTLIVQAVSRDTDSANAAFSNQTNAALTMIAERVDTGTSSGDGGGYSVWDGGKAVAGATGSTSATVSSSKNAMLTIALKPNSPPVITAPNNGNTYSASIPENTTAVTDVNATDPDTGGTLTYSLSGTDAAKFTIDASTGVVTFTTAPDFEVPTDNGANNIYDFTVTVTDNGSPAKADTQDFNITVTDVNELPIADYRLDECSWNGTVAEVKDSSGNNLHGTATSTAQTSTDAVINSSGSFANSTSNSAAISIADADILSPHVGVNGEITISAWVKLNSYPTNTLQGRVPIIAKGDTNKWEYALNVYANHQAGLSVWQSSGSSYKEISGGDLALNRWYHITGVLKKNSYARVYIDGALAFESTSGFSGDTTNGTSPLYIARRGEGNNYLNGYVDEAKIFATALTQPKIQSMYTNEQARKNYDGTTRTASCCCLPTGGNLLANPSFETLCQSTIIETWTGIEGGTVNMRNNVCGWNMNGAGMETWENTTSKPASNGTVFVEIDGSSATVDKLWQNLNTVNGVNYIIRFDYRKRSTNANSDIIIAKWNDVAITQVEGNTLGWQTAEIQVTGTASPDKLSFEEPTSDSLGSWIDNVRVVEGTLATNCTSFKYEPYHSYNVNLTPSYRLNTRLANQSFDVNVTVACAGNGTIPARQIKNIYAIDASATSCNASTPKLATLLSNGSYTINDTNKIINIPGLNSIKAYSNVKLMLETNTSEFNCSSDTMTIRPGSYTLSQTSIKSGDTLNASVTAGGGTYTGSANVTTTLATPNIKCSTQGNFLSDTEPKALTFIADSNMSTLIGKDIGNINVTIADKTWTAIDQIPSDISGATWDCIKDSNTTTLSGGKFGCDISTVLPLTINPYEIRTTKNSFYTPSSNPIAWLYLDASKQQYVEVNATLSAHGKDGVKNKNFTDGCAGSNVPLGFYFTPSTLPISGTNVSLTSTTGSQNTITDINSTYSTLFNTQYFQVPNTSFKDGDANLSLKFNFLRSNSTPINPFKLNHTNINTTYGNGVIDTNTTSLDNNATFVYGRVRAYDIKTDQTSATNPIELEVYSSSSTGYVSGMPQNVLHWYRNLNHTTSALGSILSGDDYSSTTQAGSSSTISINSSLNTPNNGLHNIIITNPDAIAHAVVHLTIPSWLWYSTVNNYDISNGTKCTQHPCFDYQFFGTATGVSTGVNSGTFQGSDFNLTPAKTIIKKGVKVFR